MGLIVQTLQPGAAHLRKRGVKVALEDGQVRLRMSSQ